MRDGAVSTNGGYRCGRRRRESGEHDGVGGGDGFEDEVRTVRGRRVGATGGERCGGCFKGARRGCERAGRGERDVGGGEIEKEIRRACVRAWYGGSRIPRRRARRR